MNREIIHLVRMQLSGLHPPPNLHVPEHPQFFQWPDKGPVHDIHAHVGRTKRLAVGEGGREGRKEGGRGGERGLGSSDIWVSE